MHAMIALRLESRIVSPLDVNFSAASTASLLIYRRCLLTKNVTIAGDGRQLFEFVKFYVAATVRLHILHSQQLRTLASLRISSAHPVALQSLKLSTPNRWETWRFRRVFAGSEVRMPAVRRSPATAWPSFRAAIGEAGLKAWRRRDNWW